MVFNIYTLLSFTYVGVKLGYKVFQLTDLLSKSLQSSTLNGADAKKLAVNVMDQLKNDRDEGRFTQFYAEVTSECDKLGKTV